MKLDHYNRNVLTNGGETSAFTIQMNGAAFAILSDAIYQHKIAAVVREISCNAYDSHVEAGVADRPFKIVLPNRFQPNLIIEDFGMGLDDNGVRNVFASYFNSTKSASNDVTGGMGIGAKSIFAYSSTFIITACKNGVERTYTAFIGEEGVPQVQLLDETPTEKGNGVAVKVPVKPSDFNQFYVETSVIAAMFPTIPEVVGGETEFAPVCTDVYSQIEKQGYAQLPKWSGSKLYSERAYALMGNVLYPLPTSVLNVFMSSFNGFFRHITSQNEIVFKFEIGELTPAASRETLSLNQKTEAFLVSRINQKIAQIIEEEQERVSEHDHPVSAIKYVVDKFGTGLFSTFKYGKKSLSDWYKSVVSIHYPNTVRSVERSSGRSHTPRMRHDSFWSWGAVAGSEQIVAFYGEKVKEITERHLAAYIKAGGLRIGQRFVSFASPMGEHKRARFTKLLGVPITWISFPDVKEAVKKDRASRAGISYNNGEKTDTTVYAKVHNDAGVVPIRHVDVMDGNTYVAVDSDATYINPAYFGGDVKFLLRNSVNKGKMASLGVQEYEDFLEEFIEDHKEAILRGKERQQLLEKVSVYSEGWSSLPMSLLMKHSAQGEQIQDGLTTALNFIKGTSASHSEFFHMVEGDMPVSNAVNEVWSKMMKDYDVVFKLCDWYGRPPDDVVAEVIKLVDFKAGR